MLQPNQIFQITIRANEWFDKINGNSYFAGVVMIHTSPTECKNIVMPFQYGYGDSYLYAAKKILAAEIEGFDENQHLHWWCYKNVIPHNYHIQRKCLKRELMQYKD